MGRITKDLILQ